MTEEQEAELRYEAGMYQGLYEIAKDRIEALEAALEDKDEALHKIESWSRAYPLAIFPEPDWKKATELLKAGGITMDAVSAHCMRHVVEGVGAVARAALAEE